MARFIGGFFEMAHASSAVAVSVADHWGLPEQQALGYANGRSALAALALVVKPRKVWLPAYICSSVAEAFILSGVSVAYYPVGDRLEPDTDALEAAAQASDLLLGVNYFGRAPDERFLAFVGKRKDMTFVEDCALTLESGKPCWGTWRLVSPRKLLGVADGGYIVSGTQPTPGMSTSSVSNTDCDRRWKAAKLRSEDEAGRANNDWHKANQRYEAAQGVSDARISELSHALLKRMDAQAIIKRRKENFTTLSSHLAAMAFIQQPVPDFCPSGFPMRLSPPLRTVVRDALIAEGIFPAIHWADLPSPRGQFPDEHALTKELLTLPCDQRYGKDDMQAVAACVMKVARK